MHLKTTDWKRFRRKQRLQRCPNGQVMAIFGRSPKTRMFGKKAKGRPRETFKKSPKKYPSLQRAKSTLARMSLSCNLYPLILQRLEKIFGAKGGSKSAQMARLWQFLQGHQKPAFSVKVQSGDQGKYFKNLSKSKPRLKGRKALLRKWYYLLIIMHLRAKTGKDFGANSGFKSARMAKLWQFSQGRPKPAFSKKVQKGDQGKFFKNRPKSSLRLKGPKKLCPKWHYPPTSMLLRCKEWKRFWHTRRLQKCPNGEVMAIFARSPKTRIF